MPLTLVVTGLHVRAVGSWSCGTGAALRCHDMAPVTQRRHALALTVSMSTPRADAVGS